MEKFADVATKVGNQIHLRSLRDAFATIMPLYILAGFAVLINNIVFPLFLADDALAAAQTWGNALTQGTLSFSGVIICGLIGYCLGKNKRFENTIACVVVSISALMCSMPLTVDATLASDSDSVATVVEAFLTSNTGTNGLFGGIVIGLLATTIFIKLSGLERLKIKLGEGIPPMVAESFNVLIPMMATLALFGLIAAFLSVGFSTDFIALIRTWIQAPFTAVSTSVPGVILILVCANLLFFVGIHESTITGVFLEPVMTILLTENMAAYAAGGFGAITPDHFMNQGIITTFVIMGGSGCTITLIADTLLFSKNKASREIAKLGLLPGLFNINEPIIYGYPIVYNLTMLIPFIVVPVVNLLIGWGATTLGLMNPMVSMLPWTTPPFISAFLATGLDWRAPVIQIIVFALDMAIYLPFLKINDRMAERQTKEQEAAASNA